MRSTRLLLLSTCLLGGCTGFGGFELTLDIPEQRVDGNPLGGLLGTPFDAPIPLMIDLASETAARDTGPAQHVRLSALTLSITPTAEPEGDTDDLAFIDRAEIFVESTQSGSSLPRVRVAVLEQVPAGTRQVSFETDASVDLLPYVQEGARLTSSADGEVPPDDVTFEGSVLLSVEVL